MTFKMTLPLLMAALAGVYAAPAQSAECRQELKWSDATYAKRTTVLPSDTLTAEITGYSNGMHASMTVNGATSAVLRIDSKGGSESIYFTYGDGKPKPSEFGEVSMLVEPPMSQDWKRFGRPCSMEDKVAIKFDERDLPAGTRDIKLVGTIERDGAQLSYSMDSEAPPPNGRGKEKWEGVLNYSRQTKLVPMDKDMQGWHVWRGGTFVRTLPAGKPITIGSVLGQLNKSPR